MSLTDLIKEKIAKSGPISVAEYMQLALAHPQFGYYMQKDPLGAKGDFITAPEISQLFGEILGAFIAEEWRVMEKPKAALVELGPGRGTLMADLLRVTEKIPEFHDAVSVHMVEASPALKEKQQQALKGKHRRISWHENLDGLPPTQPWFIVANEFFDALPIRQFMHIESGWQECMVGLDGDKFSFLFSPCAGRFLNAHFPEPKNGVVYEFCEAGEQMMRKIGAHIFLHGGALLAVDYGYDGAPEGSNTLQSVKAHKPHDPLIEPGSADLTAHVDFAGLKKAAIQQGAAVYGPTAQGKFLVNLGAGDRAAALCKNATQEQRAVILSGFERLVSVKQMGELFKVLCVAPAGRAKPEGF